jgi:hypothetical protein
LASDFRGVWPAGAEGRRIGDWFGHSGFNSGYLTLALGSKTGGRGLVVMAIIAPEDCPVTRPNGAS